MIVDVSGYSYSGKGAVMDILRDFPTLHVHKKEFEFLLLRSTDGLLDLRSTLVDSPSEIRVDMAIRRFIALLHNLSSNRTSLVRPASLFSPPGQNYSEIFSNFDEYSLKFIEKINTCSEEYWPFPSLYKSSLGSFLEKVGNVFSKPGVRSKFNSYLSREQFDLYMNEYIRDVLFSALPAHKEMVVTSNMLEVYNPFDFFKAIQPCKLLVVDRDPRGIFCSLPIEKDALDDTAAAHKFINKFKFQRSNRFQRNLNHNNVMQVKFEDLFIDFEKITKDISVFLEVPAPVEFTYFSKTKSIQNLRPWSVHKDKAAIKIIENELPSFLMSDDKEIA